MKQQPDDIQALIIFALIIILGVISYKFHINYFFLLAVAFVISFVMIVTVEIIRESKASKQQTIDDEKWRMLQIIDDELWQRQLVIAEEEDKRICNAFKKQFKQDYLYNDELLNSLNVRNIGYLKSDLSTITHYFNTNDTDYRYKKSIRSVSWIIKEVCLIKWLSDTGYGSILYNKKQQLEYYDDYGDIVSDNYHKEIEQLFKRKRSNIQVTVAYSVKDYYLNFLGARNVYFFKTGNSIKSSMLDMIKYVVQDFFEPSESQIFNYSLESIENDKYKKGILYEKKVAEILSDLGWVAKVTKGSHDQGVDIVAVRNRIRLVVQCKFYSSSVGNKAVQEIFSGKSYYSANLAVVVSNNSFTKSAKQLASSSGVLLLHHSNLQRLDKVTTQKLAY